MLRIDTVSFHFIYLRLYIFGEWLYNLVKFADDTAMIGRIVGDDASAYLHQLDTFV